MDCGHPNWHRTTAPACTDTSHPSRSAHNPTQHAASPTPHSAVQPVPPTLQRGRQIGRARRLNVDATPIVVRFLATAASTIDDRSFTPGFRAVRSLDLDNG